MTLTPPDVVDQRPAALDRPRRVPIDRESAAELGASALAAVVLVRAPFHLIGLNAPFGFVVCWFAALVSIYGVVVRQRHGLLEVKDKLATLVIGAASLLALLPLGFLLYYVVEKSRPAFWDTLPSLSFMLKDLHHFGPRDPLTNAGMYHAIIGTIEQVGIATLVSVPIGVLTAAYLNEIGGRFAGAVRTVADAMTGLPSIIAGLFIYSAWILPQGQKGVTGLAASMALTVVMLPTVVRTAEEVLRLVSDSLREAALALGSPEWRTILQVVIPTARTGLVTAAILGVARAIGETAPVLLTAGGSTFTNLNPFRGYQADLPLTVYELVKAPRDNNVKVAWGGAMLLLIIVLTLFTLARILGSGGAGKRSRKSRIRLLVARLRGSPATGGAAR